MDRTHNRDKWIQKAMLIFNYLRGKVQKYKLEPKINKLKKWTILEKLKSSG